MGRNSKAQPGDQAVCAKTQNMGRATHVSHKKRGLELPTALFTNDCSNAGTRTSVPGHQGAAFCVSRSGCAFQGDPPGLGWDDFPVPGIPIGRSPCFKGIYHHKLSTLGGLGDLVRF